MKQTIPIHAAAVLYVFCATGISLAAGTSAAKYLDRPPEWYRTEEASRIGGYLLSYQASSGGWPELCPGEAANQAHCVVSSLTRTWSTW